MPYQVTDHEVVQAGCLAAIAAGGMGYGLPAGLMVDVQAISEKEGPGIVVRAARKVARTVSALWDGLPGPWPVKVVLVALAVAEPGPFGEMALGAYATFMAARKARRTA